jgi:hypothetical protein
MHFGIPPCISASHHATRPERERDREIEQGGGVLIGFHITPHHTSDGAAKPAASRSFQQHAFSKTVAALTIATFSYDNTVLCGTQGAVDAKITSGAMAKAMMVNAVSGPTHVSLIFWHISCFW